MKKIGLITGLILLSFSFEAFCQHLRQGWFKVLEIKTYRFDYLITAVNLSNSDTIVIFSEKPEIEITGQSICIDSMYRFDLTPLLDLSKTSAMPPNTFKIKAKDNRTIWENGQDIESMPYQTHSLNGLFLTSCPAEIGIPIAIYEYEDKLLPPNIPFVYLILKADYTFDEFCYFIQSNKPYTGSGYEGRWSFKNDTLMLYPKSWEDPLEGLPTSKVYLKDGDILIEITDYSYFRNTAPPTRLKKVGKEKFTGFLNDSLPTTPTATRQTTAKP